MPLSSVLGAQSLVRPGVCTSSTRPASPFEGQTIYETDTDRLATWDGSAWIPYVRQTAGKVLQVVSTTKTDTFTTSAQNVWTDITGFSATITPSSTSSKILVTTSLVMAGRVSINAAFARLLRDGTAIGVGDAAGSRTRTTFDTYLSADDDFGGQNGHSFLDSPSTTSAVTYKWQVYNFAASGTVYVNRGQADTDNQNSPRSASSIILTEISG